MVRRGVPTCKEGHASEICCCRGCCCLRFKAVLASVPSTPSCLNLYVRISLTQIHSSRGDRPTLERRIDVYQNIVGPKGLSRAKSHKTRKQVKHVLEPSVPLNTRLIEAKEKLGVQTRRDKASVGVGHFFRGHFFFRGLNLVEANNLTSKQWMEWHSHRRCSLRLRAGKTFRPRSRSPQRARTLESEKDGGVVMRRQSMSSAEAPV